MGKYTEAAHRAADAVELQAEQMPCQNPANNLLYAFLEEVRRMKQNAPAEHFSSSQGQRHGYDNFLRNIKVSLDSLRDYPLKIYDAKGAQELKGIGGAIAKLIDEELWKEYPPDPPQGRELEQHQAAREALKQAAKRKKVAEDADAIPIHAPVRRRTSAEGSASGSGNIPSRPGGNPADVPSAAAARAPADVRGGPSRGAPAAPAAAAPVAARARVAKPYVPGIGTANFAFMIVLLQAQKGPEKAEFLTKDNLMSRAEASGLADKPIQGEGNPARGHENSRNFYNGWSNFKRLVNDGLATSYSNPKKVALISKGLALAERLYRDAVARGRASPVQGLPTEGPMLFQLEEERSPAETAAAAAEARAMAGLGSSAMLSAALRPGGHQSAAAPEVGVVQPPRARKPVSQKQSLPRSVLDVPLAERLGTGQNGTAAAQRPLPGGGNARQQECIFLDLAGSDTDEDEDARREAPGPSRVQQRRQSQAQQAQQAQQQQQVVEDDVGADMAVAKMVEMGFSDRKARKALRRSGNLIDALDVITILSSGGETSDEDEEPAIPANAVGPSTFAPNNPILAPVVAPVRPQVGAAGRLGHIRNSSQTAVQRPRLGSQSQSQSQGVIDNNVYGGGGGSRRQVESVDDAAGSIPRPPSAAAAQGWASMLPILPSAAGIRTAAAAPPPPPQQTSQTTTQGTRNWWLRGSDIRLPPLTPGRTFDQEYQVVLLVDGREQYSRNNSSHNRNETLQGHLDAMRGSGLAVEHRTLPIGDALWVARSRSNSSHEYVLDYILERKSLTDLLQSIRDSNRYSSQKYFLKRCELQNVYYLIEGDAEALGEGSDYKAVSTAAAKTEVIDGFRVLRTKSVQDTFRLYHSMTDKISALYRPLCARQGGGEASIAVTFDAFKAHVRKCNEGATTLHDVWGRMLAEVPGLGPDSVSIILETYPTPAALWKAYRDAIAQAMRQGRDARQAAEALLAGLRTANGTRSVGVEKSRRVYENMFMNKWNLQGRV